VVGFSAEIKEKTAMTCRKCLGLRMHLRRFTRLTNAHSKKLENHKPPFPYTWLGTISCAFTPAYA
jgi:hypothetical protein